jgi:hypothetical protein
MPEAHNFTATLSKAAKIWQEKKLLVDLVDGDKTL